MNEIIIDISEHNGYIDFNALKASNIVGAIIRAGYGLSTIDNQFKRNIEGLKTIGKKVGIYWFSYAGSEEAARTEARKCIETIKCYSLDLPIFFDWEYDSDDYNSRHGNVLNRNQITNLAIAFCDEIQKAGYKAGVYYNLDYQNRKINVESLRQNNLFLWYAQYSGTKSTQSGDIHLWQYSSSGTVKNLSGGYVNTDMNIVLNDDIFIKQNKVEQKEETKEENKTNTETEQEKTKYIFGENYTIVADGLRVRENPSLNARIKPYNALTANAQEYAYNNGTLKENTIVTCLGAFKDEYENIWLKIPSGYICAYLKQINEYYVK